MIRCQSLDSLRCYGAGSLPAAAAAAGAGAGAGMVARGRPDQAPLADKPPYSSGDRLTQGAMAGHPLTPDLSPRSDAWRPKSGNASESVTLTPGSQSSAHTSRMFADAWLGGLADTRIRTGSCPGRCEHSMAVF